MNDVVRKGDRIEIGDTVRIEAGPARRRRRATDENLSNAVTKDHYQLGALDASGKPIVAGAMFEYLDFYGAPVFYVFERIEIGQDDPRFAPGDVDPNAPALDEGSTNVTRYSYVFEDRGSFATEDEAIEFGTALAAGE